MTILMYLLIQFIALHALRGNKARKHFIGCYAINDEVYELPQYREISKKCLTNCKAKGFGTIVIGGIWCGCHDSGPLGFMRQDCQIKCAVMNNPECHCNNKFPEELTYNKRARYLAQSFLVTVEPETQVDRGWCFTSKLTMKKAVFNTMPEQICKHTPMTVYNSKEGKSLNRKGCFGKDVDGYNIPKETNLKTAQRCLKFCGSHKRKLAAYVHGLFCGCVLGQWNSFESVQEITEECQSAVLCFADPQGMCMCSNSFRAKQDQTSVKKSGPKSRLVVEVRTCYNRKVKINNIMMKHQSASLTAKRKSGSFCWSYCRRQGQYKFSLYSREKDCRCQNWITPSASSLKPIRLPNTSCSSACDNPDTYCGSPFSAAVYSIREQKTVQHFETEIKTMSGDSDWAYNKKDRLNKDKQDKPTDTSDMQRGWLLAAGFGLLLLLGILLLCCLIRRHSKRPGAKNKLHSDAEEGEGLLSGSAMKKNLSNLSLWKKKGKKQDKNVETDWELAERFLNDEYIRDPNDDHPAALLRGATPSDYSDTGNY